MMHSATTAWHSNYGIEARSSALVRIQFDSTRRPFCIRFAHAHYSSSANDVQVEAPPRHDDQPFSNSATAFARQRLVVKVIRSKRRLLEELTY